ncbi:hypothetical protein ONE63_011439 [Megalurothrips usitatus]|uniref:Retrovirus-related Pol polyprotein from transposon TNT 1-94 n=1 Tax=Megalurothrips usitatus TaxID=439358 RepID=A0AAV7WZZ5_9NEOP|nr:hypothetical protein ONE63_011439 [Megalurothrips usitatus]
MNRSLVEKVRCLLIAAGLPEVFGGEAVKTSAFLRNLTPSRSIGNKCPQQIWSGMVPDYSHLKVFDCLAYAKVPKEKHSKFQPVGKPFIFVGYSEESKGFRLIDSSCPKKIIKSRDVVFLEDKLGIKCHSSFDQAVDPVCSNDSTPVEPHGDDVLDHVDNDDEEKGHSTVRRNPPRTRRPVYKEDEYVMHIFDQPDVPSSVEQAMKSQNWTAAMQAEFDALIENQTWSLVPRPEKTPVITCKWVFQKKPDRFKASPEEIQQLTADLAKMYPIRDLGEATLCLGMNIMRENGAYYLDQSTYAEKVLERFGMENTYPVGTPLLYGTQLQPDLDCGDQPFQRLIGSLMYLSVATRPDLAHAVSYPSQFTTRYSEEHWVAAKRVLRYLKGSLTLSLCYRKSDQHLKIYADANWGNCNLDEKSTTGFISIYASSPISWESRKQKSVALSTTEAEYVAMSEATKESVYLGYMLGELLDINCSLSLYCDNRGAIDLANNPVFHRRSKHIAIRYHFIREALEKGLINISHVPTGEMLADFLTKALPKPTFMKCICCIGLCNKP